jgi:hypothetical protein
MLMHHVEKKMGLTKKSLIACLPAGRFDGGMVRLLECE